MKDSLKIYKENKKGLNVKFVILVLMYFERLDRKSSKWFKASLNERKPYLRRQKYRQYLTNILAS